jgi:hypothetical protein
MKGGIMRMPRPINSYLYFYAALALIGCGDPATNSKRSAITEENRPDENAVEAQAAASFKVRPSTSAVISTDEGSIDLIDIYGVEESFEAGTFQSALGVGFSQTHYS